MLNNPPPHSLAELDSRAKALTGKTLRNIADELGVSLPENLHHHKGLIGQCLEGILGADAGCDSRPDFTSLNVELKTVPVDAQHRPKESTYVCTVPLKDLHQVTWENSVVKAKLSHVLWVPILSHPDLPIDQRIILEPIRWQPNAEQLETLENDFNELMDMIAMGEMGEITASLGDYLHIRPKAAHAKVLTEYTGENADEQQTLPRGFYLRTALLRELLA